MSYYIIILSYMFFGIVIEIVSIIFSNRSNLTFSAEAYPTLSEVIGYTIAGYLIIVTGILSYFIWRTRVRSYEVTEAVKSLTEYELPPLHTLEVGGIFPMIFSLVILAI